MAEVPARLRRAGREVDPVFEPSESLFRRLESIHFKEGQILEGALPFPAFSVNREKYSEPADVISGYPGYGIYAFQVADLPAELQAEDGRSFRFPVEHVPDEANYAHAEVRSYLSGYATPSEPPKLVRKLFRRILLEKVRVLQAPTSEGG